MNWIRDIENRLKTRHKQRGFGFRLFQVLVYFLIILFVLSLFVNNKEKVKNNEVIMHGYHC